MPFFIYILHSSSTDKYYVGQSEDPFRRLIEHNSGKFHKSTTSGRPWEIQAIFEIPGGRGDALKIESFIKKQKSRKLIEKQIGPQFIPSSSLAQLVRVPHVRD
ncbi:GIY-YIG nuclease family protein [Algoriphagus sp.]|uniref:GIY-YIG nuclease family protein n=1 Tax=Algoriphagus sp. TaxID=1872435 RepID=UPI003918DA0B